MYIPGTFKQPVDFMSFEALGIEAWSVFPYTSVKQLISNNSVSLLFYSEYIYKYIHITMYKQSSIINYQ